MSKILVLGCGGLEWSRRSAQFSRRWLSGHLPEKICFDLNGPLVGEVPGLDAVSLAEELDRRAAWHPARRLGPPPAISVQRGEAVPAPILPSWQELARLQARWASLELQGPGVLVTPEDWRQSDAGRQLLEAWDAKGWLWASLEKVLARRFSAAARFVSSSGAWVRITQGEGTLVCAGSTEAARAGEVAVDVLERALAEVDPPLAERWRREEEPLSGWYVHQQLSHRLVKALRAGRDTVELGGSSLVRFLRDGRMIIDPAGTTGVLFRFSSTAAQERYQVLSTLRFHVDLSCPPLSWWQEVSRPGFLQAAAGGESREIDWAGRRLVFVTGTDLHQLASYLSQLEPEAVAPGKLVEAVHLAARLPQPEDGEQRSRTAPASTATGELAPPPAAKEAVGRSALAEPAMIPAPAEPVAERGGMEPAAPAAAVPPTDPAGCASAIGGGPSAAGHGSADTVPEPPTPGETAAADPQPLAASGTGTPPEPGAPVTALATFQPRQFSLEMPHRPGRIQVWLDGKPVEQGNIRRSSHDDLYTIEGMPVPHGAIVRVDFESLAD